jgi:hypothetical protein
MSHYIHFSTKEKLNYRKYFMQNLCRVLAIILSVAFSCQTAPQKLNTVDNSDTLIQLQSVRNKTYTDPLKKNVLAYDSIPMLQTFPANQFIEAVVNDSNTLIVTEKCVVFPLYTENELNEKKKSAKNEDEWETYYDDLTSYANEASLFLYDKTKKINADKKDYIQFNLSTGKKYIISRKEAVEYILFFNPNTGLKQCEIYSFQKEKYTDY